VTILCIRATRWRMVEQCCAFGFGYPAITL
jgi:hypothetical protein